MHYCRESRFGPYWSITKFNDILYVDRHHDIFSSRDGVSLGAPVTVPREKLMNTPMFIAMDPPRHDVQRAAVQPAVEPQNLRALEGTIRERAGRILDSLPENETFNWVDRVSIELTTQMLATLFDFPFEERRKLTRWSDVATGSPRTGVVDSHEQRVEELHECLAYFTRLWNERVNRPPANDLISMLAHGEDTRNMKPMEFLGNLLLLIVGGNDTTRNSISGRRAGPQPVPGRVRQAPRNTGIDPQHDVRDHPLADAAGLHAPHGTQGYGTGRQAHCRGRHGADVVRLRQPGRGGHRESRCFSSSTAGTHGTHLSFGFGIHRCMGNRLAEMQLRVLWEEIMKRFRFIEVVGEPVRTLSAFVKGYTALPVRVHRLRAA